jgi:hypothetical protein
VEGAFEGWDKVAATAAKVLAFQLKRPFDLSPITT